MSPFKEPQPRKNSAAEDAKKVIGGNWPPYAREGGEVNWMEKKAHADIAEARRSEAQWTMTDTEFNQSLETAREEAVTDLEVRTTALEAAVKLRQGLDYAGDTVVVTAGIFEAYLRNGKPS